MPDESFQSSPGTMAGCDIGRASAADATMWTPTRHDGRVRRWAARSGASRPADVSILTGTMAGCDVMSASGPARCQVSILTGTIAGDDLAGIGFTAGTGFNPHPARWPGATFDFHVAVPTQVLVQSSPGTIPGDSRTMHNHRRVRCFNPHPARMAGCDAAYVCGDGRGVSGFRTFTRHDQVRHLDVVVHPSRPPVWIRSPGTIAGVDDPPLASSAATWRFQS